ncbi:hypothetical protein IWY39_002563 [Sphingobium sp. JAI105]|uniref:gp53-like domain-containing protein n=1 Tax=Sphingobium sp. JAI105 TaxID=2787715 RepID=UPI0018C93DC7|nr:hypothetical protein [Sphingobium sp. JAI105]MBG6118759.1 hypothetical protein [Sphingobium sp. JAI105]
MAIELLITTAGLDALVDAQAGETDAIRVIEVGLTANAFTMAPTITVLPGELKRIDAVSGQAVSETIIHMTALDSSNDVYDLRGIGLYLDDGTLFAVYAQPDPIFRKVSIASFLLALDVAFANGGAADIIFGESAFLFPPATETVKGVAEIATGTEVAAGTDDSRVVTPLKLKQRLDTLLGPLGISLDAINAALLAFGARTIVGEGLATGGGDLSGDRVITVAGASTSEAAAGSSVDKAVTPASLIGALSQLGGWNATIPLFKIPGTPIIVQLGYYRAIHTAEVVVPITFADAFPNSCLFVAPIPYISAADNLRDMFVQMRDRSSTGFQAYIQAPDAVDNRIDGFDWLAIGV